MKTEEEEELHYNSKQAYSYMPFINELKMEVELIQSVSVYVSASRTRSGRESHGLNYTNAQNDTIPLRTVSMQYCFLVK